MASSALQRPKTIGVAEAAERLGTHQNTIRNWADRELLAAYKTPTGRRKILLSDVERLEREMYGAPDAVELAHTTEVPAQVESPERIGYLP